MTSRGETTTNDEAAFTRARSLFLGAAATVVVGLGVAGTGDRALGGALLLAGWGLTILALHRLGRTGAR